MHSQIQSYTRLAYSLCVLALLQACGNGNDNPFVEMPRQSQSRPITPSTASPTRDVVKMDTMKAEDKTPTFRIDLTELLTDVTLPALPANDWPDSSIADEFSISQLKSELYSIQWSHLDGDHSAPDCPQGSALKCPSFSRYQLSRDGRILARTWAYLPLSSQWAEIKSFAHAFDGVFDLGQVVGDGHAWQETAPLVSQWAWHVGTDQMAYRIRDTQIKLIGTKTQLSQGTAGQLLKYKPKPDQQVLQFRMAVTEGEYLSLRPFAFQPFSSEKPAQPADFTFIGMAKFRRALTEGKAFCLEMNGVPQLLQFEPLRLGAKVYAKADQCKTPMEPLPLDSKSHMTQLQEGVKTIFDRQVIYLSQLSRPSTGEMTSSSQYYWALSTDSKNNPLYGKAYQKGFIKTVPTDFYDAVFVQDWLSANSNYKQGSLPR